MFFTNAAILGLAAMVAAQGNSDFGHCDHNACLQQVHRAAAGHGTGYADCSSFLSVTVTPAASTTTVVDTVTVTTTTVVGAGGPVLRARRHAARVVAPRQVTATPTAIPAYASGCTANPTAYASACSCIGVPGGATTTAPAPPDSTAFSTITTTETVTSTSSPPAPQLTVLSYDTAPGYCGDAPYNPPPQVITTNGCASINSNNAGFGTYVAAPGCTCVVEFYSSADCSGPLNTDPSPQDPTSNTCYNRFNPYGPVPIINFNSVKLVCTGTC
ncbi:hypothetical protein QBC37DRAFT_382437 [Rhypophila decipiens]|uniref:Uncharacterized protein n=1 Tax=Rhypophila decipiens TaxID=261697 RepID=A0AAN7BD85_9PEZI|nr:hypothetical protein QBC37DRAFT_382437 [Rhypophila decipiens]